MSGTKRMATSKNSSFSVSDIERIIEVCHEKGVGEIDVGGLKLKFKEAAVEPRAVPLYPPQVAVNHEQQAKDSLAVDELREKEERLGLLLLENPEEFERQLANGELLEEDEGSDESSDEAHDS